ncbi:hypothetical protein [Nocardiopsis sp. M1B1]|uniref:hypothetical protein n=1 Tax=Nocardiopsis sp. M1B1 TaxID=3450454 RepID=UPI0040394533
MRTFTRITAAAVLAAGLTVAGTGAAMAATADQDDSRPGGVLGFLFDGVFGENADPPVVGEDNDPPEVNGAPGTTAEETPAEEAPADEAPAAPAEQGTGTNGATGGM